MIINKNWAVILFLICCLKNYSATYTSTGCPANWSGFDGSCSFFNGGTRLSFQPATGDILVIPAGCTVTVDGAITANNDITLIIDGQLKFNGAADRLNLSDGSTIIVNSGGSISGPSSSNQIKIGAGSSEWSGPGTSTGPFTLVNGSVLPIELLDFSGTCLTNGVQLNWNTATELNNDYFLIERSSNGTDWELVAKVGGNGTSNSIHTYIYGDYNLNSNELIYYRLSQVDFGGTKTIFKMIDVNCNKDIPDKMIFYPNPASTELNIHLDVNEPSTNSIIRLINTIGQTIMGTKVELTKGVNSFVFPVDFESGTYTILVSSNNITVPSQKLLVVK